MTTKKNKEDDIRNKKHEVNTQHIEYYDKVFSILIFILEEYSKELTRADIDFLDMPKNTVSVLDFLISAIGKVQKGQRLALGLDEEVYEDTSPQINIIEGLSENKI